MSWKTTTKGYRTEVQLLFCSFSTPETQALNSNYTFGTGTIFAFHFTRSPDFFLFPPRMMLFEQRDEEPPDVVHSGSSKHDCRGRDTSEGSQMVR